MPDNQPSCVPSEVDAKLRIGIFRMLEAKYRPCFGARSKFLSAAVFNRAFLEPPGNEEAKRFLEASEGLIKEEASGLHLDASLRMALSVLYTFTLVRLGPKDPERTMALVERATDLNIPIFTTQELYPTDDAAQFLALVDEYADRLLGD